jgi:actin-related protein
MYIDKISCYFVSFNFVNVKASSEAEFYVGNEAQTRREILAMTSPIDRGIVTNWEDMELLWQYIYTGVLHVSPEEYNVLTSETYFVPKACKELMLQVIMNENNFS